MIVGLLIGLGTVKIACDIAGDRSKAAYPELDTKQFDLENMAYGVDPTDIYRIAARCGVRPKNGCLPYFGYEDCLSYVRKYTNNHKEIGLFIESWKEEVKRQEEKQAEKLIKESTPTYNELVEILESHEKDDGSIILTYNHWWDLTPEEHTERVQTIYEETYIGQRAIKPPIVRFDPEIYSKRTEVWVIQPDRGDKQGESQTMNKWARIYSYSCRKCGYDPKLSRR